MNARWWVAIAVVLSCAIAVLQMPVSTRQGWNYVVSRQTIPLYLKAARFVMRDLESRYLVAELTRGVTDPEQKALRLLAWVRTAVHAGVPPELTVVDDHPWSIIIRGYGSADQLADVLATLCAYAGVPGAVVPVNDPETRVRHDLVLVKLRDGWCPLDPYYGPVIRRADGHLATQADLRRDPSLVRRAAPGVTRSGVEYATWYETVPDAPVNDLAARPSRQMPLRRLLELFRRGVGGWRPGAAS